MKNKYLFNLGNAMRMQRGELKISQEKLAERCGFHRNYIGKIERGEQNLTISSLVRIAEAMECHAHELLQRAAFSDEQA
ncbi:MAG: helix-turn-helix transcriptional regulator [Verrucomicrobia bacterium]|nr:helix-turn-helix transcriptional regulator [Verrucomicrobiota bacterium]